MNREDLLKEIKRLRRRVAELEETQVRLTNKEPAVHERDAGFSALSEHTFEAIFLSEEGICIGQNLAAEKMFGYTTAEALGRRWTEWIAPEYRELVKKNMLLDYAPSHEVMARRKDGATFPCEIQGKMVDHKGRLVRVTAVRDITDRKKAEDALKESEELYRELVESVDALVCKHDLQGNLLFVSQGPARLLGYSSEEMVGTNMRSYLAPEVRDQFPAYLDALQKDGRAGGLMHIQTKSGESRLCEYRSKVRTQNGGESIVVGIARDVTERKRVEKDLVQAEQKYRRLFEDAPLMYVITRNEQGVPYISDCNQFFLRTVGFSRDEVLGQPLGNFYSPESTQALLEGGGYARALAGQFLIGERQLLTRDGRLVPTLLYTTPEEDTHGQVIGTRAMFVDITDRNRAERALKEAHEIINRSKSVAFLWKNAEGWPVEFVTDNVAALFGYTAGEFTSGEVPYSATVHPDDLERVAEEVSTYSQEKGRLAFDHEPYRIVTKERKTKWVEDSTVIRRNEKGEVTHFQGILNDITGRVLTEQALKESEHNLLEAQRIAHIGSWIWNLDSDEVACSDEMLRIWGYPPEKGSLTFDEVMERIHPRDRDLIREALGRALKEDVKYDVEFRIVLPDKGERVIHGVGDVERGEEGTPSVVRGTGLDITERKKTEDALKESRERFRLLSEMSREGIVFHKEGVILDANPQYSGIFGYEVDELLGRQAIPLTVAPESIDVVMNHIKSGFEGTYEVTGLRKDGTRFPVEICGRRGEYEGGKVRVATFRDMSERKHLEEQLRSAQKMEAVGTLAGGIAHDFNNLLQIIAGHAELLEMELAQRGLRFSEVDAIRQSAHRGADLVKQILTFSRRIESKFELINLNEDVKNAGRLLYRTIPRMIEIELKLEENLKPVQADSTQVEQMLINLAVNAKDAMPEGGRLIIETQNVNIDQQVSGSYSDLTPGEYVLLRMSDTGHGMNDDVLQHVFEPFFTTKEVADGTGLGLTSVFGIVKMHGGHITCDSEVGMGTTFSVYFPAAQADKVKNDEVQAESAVSRGSEMILVVDDEPLIADLAKRILEKSGYSVITAGSGKEALEIYSQQQAEIDLVVLDLIMPEMGGKQCLEEMLKINSQVKALIASGFAIKGDTKAFLDTEAKGKVAKPFNMRDLLRSVRYVLDGA